MPTSNTYAQLAPRNVTSKPRDILTAQSLSISDSQPGLAEISQFKVQGNEADLIFRSALPEDLEWEARVEDVALSMDAIKRCLANTLVALDRATPQTRADIAVPLAFTEQEVMSAPHGSGSHSQNWDSP